MSEIQNLRVVEYRPHLAEDALRVRNAIFPYIPLEDWLATTETMTGTVAYADDEVVGCIPMDRRKFLIAPDRTLTVAFENAVGTREDMRSKGIGTAMIDHAQKALADRLDALMVYRGAERSRGYRFYAKTGHQDMVYIRRSRWEAPEGEYGNVAIAGPDRVEDDKQQIARVFSTTFSEFAGHPPRSAGYQHRQLNSHIYRVLPHEILYFRYPDNGRLQAYCIVGIRLDNPPQQRATILEMAVDGEKEAIHKVLSAVGAEMADRGLTVIRRTGHDDPFRDIIRGVGFVEKLRNFMIMAQIIRPRAVFKKACTELHLLHDLKIDVWTPGEDYTLYEGPEAKTRITVEAKDSQLARWLMRRLDLKQMVDRGLVTVHNGTCDIVQRLSGALPFARWVYHHLDYI